MRVLFRGGPGEAITMHLDLVNSGTTALYYSWEQIPNVNPLDTNLHKGVQRFYFDAEGGKYTIINLPYRTKVWQEKLVENVNKSILQIKFSENIKILIIIVFELQMVWYKIW